LGDSPRPINPSLASPSSNDVLRIALEQMQAFHARVDGQDRVRSDDLRRDALHDYSSSPIFIGSTAPPTHAHTEYSFFNYGSQITTWTYSGHSQRHTIDHVFRSDGSLGTSSGIVVPAHFSVDASLLYPNADLKIWEKTVLVFMSLKCPCTNSTTCIVVLGCASQPQGTTLYIRYAHQLMWEA
jgi:hypothetical protein